MTDDELCAEFRARLVAGAFGDSELLIPPQNDYSGMWSALCDLLPEWEALFGRDHPVLHEVRTAVYRLADQRPDAVRVFALATTEYGRHDD